MKLLFWCMVTIVWVALVVALRGLIEKMWKRVSLDAAEHILVWLSFALVVVAAVFS